MEDFAPLSSLIYTDKEYKMHVPGACEEHFGSCGGDILLEESHRYASRKDVPENLEKDYSLTLEQAKSFYERGFIEIHEKLVSDELISRARAYINSNYGQWLKMSRRQDDWRIHLLLNFDDLSHVEHAPILDLFLQSPELIRYMYKVMGCDPCGIFYNQIAYRTRLTDKKTIEADYTVGAEYHIDGQANAFGSRFPDPWTVQIGIALVDLLPEKMGNFTVFPGGHTVRNWSNYVDEKKAKALPSLGEPYKTTLKAGEVVLAHVLLPHRGGKNTVAYEEVEDLIDYTNLDNIPKATREMVFFRIRGNLFDYANQKRSTGVINDPWIEYKPVIRVLEQHEYFCK